jgi:tRNA pseudouridine38-40 synthase
MPRIALGISYDGRPWQGWQKQPNGQTVQDALERALAAFATVPVQTTCAGRTDTAVHALGQVVHFDCEIHRTEESWVRGVNAHLPESISVQWAQSVNDTFHARFSATARAYTYVLLNSRVRQPLWAGRAGWVFQPLDVLSMTQAAQSLLGEHDFSSFRSSQCQAKSPVRTISELNVVQKGSEPVQYMADLLILKDRTKGAPTFSPDGLYLTEVSYPAGTLAQPQGLGFGLDDLVRG